MRKIMCILTFCVAALGCYTPSFTHKDEAGDMIGDIVYAEVLYGCNDDGIGVYNETFQIHYDFNHRMQNVSYIYQQGDDGQYEFLEIKYDENGNYAGYSGQISGDMNFIDYLITVFSIEHLHEIDNNDVPYDIDLTRLCTRETEYIEITAYYEHLISNPELSQPSRVRREAVYQFGRTDTEYFKTVYLFDQEGTELHCRWDGKQWVKYEPES